MTIIIGLGNPGGKYKGTRHNIGFEIIDKFAEENNFPIFNSSKKFKSQTSKKEDIILAKPETFMNLSGQAFKNIVSFYSPEQVIVIHDDIDLPFGKIRVTKNKGSAGHKGIESIIKETGNKDFVRIRVGIMPEKKPEEVEKFVLQKFENKELLPEITKKAILAINMILNKGVEKAMTEYNR